MDRAQIDHEINRAWTTLEGSTPATINWLRYESVVRAILRLSDDEMDAVEKLEYIDDATAAFTGRGSAMRDIR